MDITEVQAIWDRTMEVMKPYFTGGTYSPKKDKEGLDEYPEFWPGYRASCREREGLLPHIEHGYYAERLFKLRAPNQTEQEAKYIRDNYRQVTLPIYADYENTILRAANESNYQIDYAPNVEGTEGQDQFKEYVNTGVPEYRSIFNYWRYVLPRIKTADAMGVIATLPAELPTVQTETGPVVDPEKPIDPVPVYFPVNDVWGYRMDAWYLVYTQEKSPVMLPSGKTAKEGMVLLLIDDEWIWRIEQVGEKVKKTFDIIQWWAHGCSTVPVHQLMGTPTLTGPLLYSGSATLRWQSHFMPAKEPCDIALLDSSYLGMSKANGVFPYLVTVGDDCDFIAQDGVTKCNYGKLLFYGEEGKIVREAECPKCKGSGMRSRLSPVGRLLINPRETGGDGKGLSVKDSMEWVSPEVTTLEFLQKQIDTNMSLARSLMHIDSPRDPQMTGGDQPTATKSGIDLRNKYAFIKPIADQYFDLLEFMLNTTGEMRYGTEFQGVEISRPTSFDIRTEQDMLDELSVAYEKELPAPAIQHLIWAYLTARYGVDGRAMDAFETIAIADELFGTPFAQAQYMLSQGLIEKWQMHLHFTAFNLYDQLAQEKKLTGDPAKDAEALKELARTSTPNEDQGGLMSIVKGIGLPPKTAAA